MQGQSNPRQAGTPLSLARLELRPRQGQDKAKAASSIAERGMKQPGKIDDGRATAAIGKIDGSQRQGSKIDDHRFTVERLTAARPRRQEQGRFLTICKIRKSHTIRADRGFAERSVRANAGALPGLCRGPTGLMLRSIGGVVKGRLAGWSSSESFLPGAPVTTRPVRGRIPRHPTSVCCTPWATTRPVIWLSQINGRIVHSGRMF